MLARLDDLAARVEAALRRAEMNAPAVAEPVGRWCRGRSRRSNTSTSGAVTGAAGDCPLPELFHAVRVEFPDLTLPAFHDGLRRLHDVRAVRLSPAAT